jgi:hypothetical protein
MSNLGQKLSGDDDEPVLKPRRGRPKQVVEPKEPELTPEQKYALASSTKRELIRITLEENENIPPTGQFFGLNGRHFMLKPGVAVDVPVEIINILNDAVQEVPEIDPTTRQVVGYRKKLRFPYRVMTGPAGR